MLFYRSYNTLINNNWRLLVKGLPFDITESEIKLLFAGYKLNSIEFISKRNKPIGSVYVYFESEHTAKEARSLVDGKYLKNKKIQVLLDFLKFDSRIQPVYKPPSLDRFRQPSKF